MDSTAQAHQHINIIGSMRDLLNSILAFFLLGRRLFLSWDLAFGALFHAVLANARRNSIASGLTPHFFLICLGAILE
jgi:hypothetical protein